MPKQESLELEADAEIISTKKSSKPAAKKTAKNSSPKATKATKNKEEITLLVNIDAKLVESNLEQYVAQIKENIASLNYELVTDEDFAEGVINAKNLRTAQKTITSQKDEILKNAEELYKQLNLMDEVSEECRVAALGMENQIKQRKAERKEELIQAAYDQVNVKDKSLIREAFTAELKGMSKFEQMESKLNKAVEQININAHECRLILDKFIADNGKSLVTDYADLEQDSPEVVQKELDNRLALYTAELEAKKAKEEAARIKKEAADAEADRIAKKVAQDKLEREQREAKERQDQNKESSTEAPDPSNTNDSEPLRKDDPDITKATSKSGNHFDKRPADTANSAKSENKLLVNTFIGAMAPVKTLGDNFRHQANIDAYAVFKASINSALQAFAKS